MYHIAFYVPENHSEKVKESMFKQGAGRIGNYDYCSFETKGLGQYRPLKGSDPYLGEENILEKVSEIKVEMVCEDSVLQSVIDALKESHPYETPAYYAIKVVNI